MREAETGALARKPRQDLTPVNYQIFTPLLVGSTWQPMGGAKRLHSERDMWRSLIQKSNLDFLSPHSSLLHFRTPSSSPSFLLSLLHCCSKDLHLASSFSHQILNRKVHWNRHAESFASVPTNPGKGGFLSHGF